MIIYWLKSNYSFFNFPSVADGGGCFVNLPVPTTTLPSVSLRTGRTGMVLYSNNADGDCQDAVWDGG